MNRVQIAARMYDARDTLRRVLGDRYAEQSKRYGDIIRGVMKRDGCTEIVALTTLGKDPRVTGDMLEMFLAACVDVIEGPDASHA